MLGLRVNLLAEHGRLPRLVGPACRCSARSCTTRSTRFPALPLRVHRRVHQHDDHRRLSGRRPARGDVRDRAHHGRARRRDRRRPDGDPAAQLDQARGVPVHDGGRARPTTRATTRPRRPRRWSCSATTSCGPSRRAGGTSNDPVQLGIGISTYTEMCGLAPSRVLGRAALRRRRLGARRRADAADRQGRGRHRHVRARQGHETAWSQIVADQLGVAVRRRRGAARRHPVVASRAWTRTAPARSPSAASRCSRRARR